VSDQTKIHLSKLEKELIQNTEWILAKRSVVEKVYQLFGALLEDYKKIIHDESFKGFSFLKNTNGKISRGENYLGLPHIMMDYPAVFEKGNTFAIRTFFWWGNFFSITLHVSGKYLQHKIDIGKSFSFLKEKDFYVCINNDEWNHTFSNDNFIPAAAMNETQIAAMHQRNFLKISKKAGVEKWNHVADFLQQSFLEIISFVKISSRYDTANPLPGFPTSGFDL